MTTCAYCEQSLLLNISCDISRSSNKWWCGKPELSLKVNFAIELPRLPVQQRIGYENIHTLRDLSSISFSLIKQGIYTSIHVMFKQMGCVFTLINHAAYKSVCNTPCTFTN